MRITANHDPVAGLEGVGGDSPAREPLYGAGFDFPAFDFARQRHAVFISDAIDDHRGMRADIVEVDYCPDNVDFATGIKICRYRMMPVHHTHH